MLAILPLVMVVLAVDYINEAAAQPAEGSPGQVSPKSYGSATDDIVCGERLCSESASASSEKSEQKLSKSTGSAEYDALTAQFAEKTQELRIANANGDSDKVAELQDELKDLRNQIVEWKNN